MYPPTSFAMYENHGFVFPIRGENEVQLLRVDTNATVAASVGTIGWRDGAVQITHAASGVSSNGEIAVVWRDHDPASSVQRLWLASCDWLTPLDSRDAPAPIPYELSLSAYPNPFNSTVHIDYDLPPTNDAELTVHNTLGQKVATLFSGRAPAGAHSVNWSPDVASGVYFVRLSSGEFVTGRKIMYVQ
ncbi:MAG: T9SS type A sorting domain-containing protein [bacterium]|nr:T9SS type A sorting domain-containing protein [bacterium]